MTNKITFKIENGTEKSYHLLKRTEFYKNILMNPSSHNDSETEIYKEECENTIFLLEELNKLLLQLEEESLINKEKIRNLTISSAYKAHAVLSTTLLPTTILSCTFKSVLLKSKSGATLSSVTVPTGIIVWTDV